MGIDAACVVFVRMTYGLPCCVIDAAAAPVKFGISARRVSAALTTIAPENVGPMTAKAPMSTARCASALDTPGLLCVSSVVISNLRPSTPPAALISLTASSTPLR